MFQYVACKINAIPYGVKNINTYSDSKIQELRQGSELITFISPADWMMFQTPKGIDFRSIQNTLGTAVRNTVDKLEVLDEFRTNEMMNVINKQYEASNKLKINSVVLLKNIAKGPFNYYVIRHGGRGDMSKYDFVLCNGVDNDFGFAFV